MMNPVLARYWPPELQLLLLTVALADPETGAMAWKAWLSQRDIDQASWAEVRLLAAITPRIEAIAPSSPLLPRLRGINRFIWTQTQMCLVGTKPLLNALREGGIRMLLLKGAARLARDPKLASQRMIRDIDVAVPVSSWPRALAISNDLGWYPKNGWPYQGPLQPGAARFVFPLHHAIGLEKDSAEVDLHHCCLAMCRNADDDHALWRDAEQGHLHRTPVLLPSATHALLIDLVHGMQYAEEPISDWVVDATSLIRSGRVDWDRFEQEAAARRVIPAVCSALTLLANRLGVEVPPDVITRLSQSLSEPYVTEFVASCTGHQPNQPALVDAVRDAAIGRALDALQRGGDTLTTRPSTARVILQKTLRVTARHTCALPIPSNLDPCRWHELRLELTLATPRPNRPLVLQVIASGLVLKHWRVEKRTDDAQAQPMSISIPCPAALLVTRRIALVTLSTHPDPVPLCHVLESIGVSWLESGSSSDSTARLRVG